MAREKPVHKYAHAIENAPGKDAFAMHLSQTSALYIQLLVLAMLAFAAFMILLPGD